MKTAWDRVLEARKTNRPKAMDILPYLFDGFIEIHGDRLYADDQALLAGLAFFEGQAVTVLAQSKGRNLEENLERNFGMLNPEGYRKAIRLAKQAEKFNRPIITIIDTAGAYPGKGAEERGQAQAIAQSLQVFSSLKVPVIALVLSEGGSGGALALSVADKLYMMENAIYSILSPEGFASILWKDDTRAKEAADLMECTAYDLSQKHLLDGIITEHETGFDQNMEFSLVQFKQHLREDLLQLKKLSTTQLLHKRYEKHRKVGKSL